jgi:aryl-alcohol dehydrogenase (NADP+)
MQNLYNLIQREEEHEMNRLCHEQGVGLIPYSPLARGFLAANRSKDGGGATERSKNDVNVQPGTYRDCDWEIAERLKKVAAGKNVSPAQAALAWMLSKPYMASPIIGATSLDQLTSAAEATEVAISADEAKLLEEPYRFRVSSAN